METYKNRITKGVSSLRWGSDAIPRLFDRISNFPHPRDALACFFSVLSVTRDWISSLSLLERGNTEPKHWSSAVCHVWTHFFFFFTTFKEKILTLERGGKKKRILSGGSDSDTGPSPSRSLHHTTVSLCPPSFGLFIHSALIFMEAKINFIWYCQWSL